MNTTKMKALRFERYGPPAVLSIQDLPLPALEDAEVLVQIKASSINPSDVGTVAEVFHSKLPMTPGRDFAGVVVDGGVWKGKQVWGTGADFGVVRPGAHAGFVAVPSSWLFLIPGHLGRCVLVVKRFHSTGGLHATRVDRAFGFARHRDHHIDELRQRRNAVVRHAIEESHCTRIAMTVLAMFLFGLGNGTIFGQTLRVPLDFSQSEIGIDATVNGEPLYILLDTGVDPSAIDLQRAEALHLKIDRNAGGQVSGFGNTEQPTAFPTTIQGFAISGHKFASFDALASDLSALSSKYGRRVDAFIGYSFLQDKIILVDYPGRSLYLLGRPSSATSATKSCRTKWSAPMQLLEGENWPLIPQLRLGDVVISATLDTGSSGSITLYEGALDMPGVRSALVQKGEVKSGGFQGEESLKKYVFNKPVGFAGFELPPGAEVNLRNVKGSSSNMANVGNKLFASMGLKMMLDYRHRTMTFFGDCR